MHIAVTVVALLAVQTPAQESRTAIDPELREIALRALIQEADTPRLIAMYDAEKNADHRELILRHLSSRGDQQARQKLVAVARQDADLELRERAVRLLGAQGESPLLIELYDEQKDREIQEVILRQLGQRSDAAARQKLLAIVKGETDDGLQEVAVRADRAAHRAVRHGPRRRRARDDHPRAGAAQGRCGTRQAVGDRERVSAATLAMPNAKWPSALTRAA
jgi:hypothetical protein